MMNNHGREREREREVMLRKMIWTEKRGMGMQKKRGMCNEEDEREERDGRSFTTNGYRPYGR